MKTAEEWIAEGYRLHWVTVEAEIAVLVKPEDADVLSDYTAVEWAREDGNWTVMARAMEAAPPAMLAALAICEDGDAPSIGSLLAAQTEAEKTAQAIRDSGQLSLPGTE